jgi:hypothetical protein
MKKAVLVVALTFAIVFVFSLASLRAEGAARSGDGTPAAGQAVRNAEASTLPAAPAAAPQPTPGNPFSLEKLIIGLGLCAVIVLAVFRWGTGTRQKKQNKGTASSGTPSA